MAKRKKAMPVDGTPELVKLAGLRLEWRDPATLQDNPDNWRQHGEQQTSALQSALAQVGWAGALLLNEQTGRLIDGHARKALAKPGELVPVLVGSWTPEQEKLILATLDPLGDLAQKNQPKLDVLIGEVKADGRLAQMLAELRTFAPNMAPETSTAAVTDQDIQDGQDKLDSRFANNNQAALRAVLCPHCATEFFIQPEKAE